MVGFPAFGVPLASRANDGRMPSHAAGFGSGVWRSAPGGGDRWRLSHHVAIMEAAQNNVQPFAPLSLARLGVAFAP